MAEATGIAQGNYDPISKMPPGPLRATGSGEPADAATGLRAGPKFPKRYRRFWQCGQKYVPRWPTTMRRIGCLQRRQACPARS